MSKILLFLSFFFAVIPVDASNVDVRASAKTNGAKASASVKVDIKTQQSEIRQYIKEVKDEQKEKIQDLRQDFKEKIASKVSELKNIFTKRVVLVNAKITAKSSSELTVEKDGKSYTVEISNKTKLRRRFFGSSDLGEFQVGQMVNVYGLWKDEAKTRIEAYLIRNLSIQKRHGVFVGIVKAISGDTWTIDTKHRGIQTVVVSSDTKLVNRKAEIITKSDVKVDHRVRVKGLWDRLSNTVTEVVHVKDYSLPL